MAGSRYQKTGSDPLENSRAIALLYIWICIWMNLAHELDHERKELIHDHPDRSDAP